MPIANGCQLPLYPGGGEIVAPTEQSDVKTSYSAVELHNGLASTLPVVRLSQPATRFLGGANVGHGEIIQALRD